MDFTELYKQTSNLVAFSPGAQFILTAVQDRVIVRRADTFQLSRTWLIDSTPNPSFALLSKAKSALVNSSASRQDGWISQVGWSCDSEYLLAACAKRGVVHLFNLRKDNWTARIDAGVEGLVKAEWAPDGRTVLCFSEWGVSLCLSPVFNSHT